MVMRPKFLGMEQIPSDRPLLFVSNHTIMGFDYPLLLKELYVSSLLSRAADGASMMKGGARVAWLCGSSLFAVPV